MNKTQTQTKPAKAAKPAKAPIKLTKKVTPAMPAIPAPPLRLNAVAHNPAKTALVDPLLEDILSQPRKHGSNTEADFAMRLFRTLNAIAKTRWATSEHNIVTTVPHKDGSPSKVLFSCHTDTVDVSSTDPLGSRKRLTYDPAMDVIGLDPKSPIGSCLGADDGVGVWIMIRMIEAGVPGTYVFHRGEEMGCIGSRAMVRDEAEFLATHSMAIAFDRPRNNEIITHQGSVRCASDAFAASLAAQFKTHDLTYEASTKGAYTDTKEYRRLIPECANLGVGYDMQHSVDEFLDYSHAVKLLDVSLKIDWEALTVERKPTAQDVYDLPQRSFYGGGRNAFWTRDTAAGSRYYNDWSDDWADTNSGYEWTGKDADLSFARPESSPTDYENYAIDELLEMVLPFSESELAGWARACPDDMAELVKALGNRLADIRDALR